MLPGSRDPESCCSRWRRKPDREGLGKVGGAEPSALQNNSSKTVALKGEEVGRQQMGLEAGLVVLFCEAGRNLSTVGNLEDQG